MTPTRLVIQPVRTVPDNAMSEALKSMSCATLMGALCEGLADSVEREPDPDTVAGVQASTLTPLMVYFVVVNRARSALTRGESAVALQLLHDLETVPSAQYLP